MDTAGVGDQAGLGVSMSDELDLASVDGFGQEEGEEDDVFHDADGLSVLGDADPFEVSLYAHHCWRLGLDPDETAALLRAD